MSQAEGSRTILGIDPGLTRCGWGLVNIGPTRELVYQNSGVITSSKDAELQDRIAVIGQGIISLLDTHHPEAIALERVFSQQNLQTVMSVAQISGVILFEAAKRNVPVMSYTPTQVKAAVSGYGKAEKQQVSNMVVKILKLEKFAGPADESDALALAICHILQNPGRMYQTNASNSRGSSLTPAQQKWRDAERLSGQRRNPRLG